MRSSRTIAVRGAALLAGLAMLAVPASASATMAVFVPRGSGARVERQHVTVAVTKAAAVTWSAVDVAGANDVGVIVAVRAGGRVEVAGRGWIDVIEAAAQVNVALVVSTACKPLGGAVGIDAGGSATGEVSGSSSGGCSRGDTDRSGTGGCYSNSSSRGCSGCGGCDGCDGIEPSPNGHPGCSAFFACSPGLGEGSSSGSSGGPPPLLRGPYDVVRVRASDGSAAAWLDANDFERGPSFDAAADAIERDGYELYALRDRSGSSPSLVRSLRVVTSSPTATLPLRLARMGAAPAATPFTLVVVAPEARRLAGVDLLRVDGASLAARGSSSNYEDLVAALLGAPPDGGTGDASASGDASRWVVESSRSVTNRAADGDAGSLADRFRAQCGEREAEKHRVCRALAGGVDDAGIADAAPNDASTEDAGDAGDAGDADAGAPDAGPAAACADVERQSCDDIDLAIPPGETAILTRFRGVVGSDPLVTGDLSFEVATEALPDGRFFVRDNGQPGLCEATIEATASIDVDADGQTCVQAPRRRWSRIDLGPLVVLLVALRAVAVIMRRARKSR